MHNAPLRALCAINTELGFIDTHRFHRHTQILQIAILRMHNALLRALCAINTELGFIDTHFKKQIGLLVIRFYNKRLGPHWLYFLLTAPFHKRYFFCPAILSCLSSSLNHFIL